MPIIEDTGKVEHVYEGKTNPADEDAYIDGDHNFEFDTVSEEEI